MCCCNCAVSKIRNADKISEIGCVPCILIQIHAARPCDIHHPFGRKGEKYHQVYGSCPWHHRGVTEGQLSAQEMGGILGPSLAWGKKTFRATFGTEQDLLDVQRFLLLQFEKSPWMSYSTPTEVRRRALELWTSLKSN